MNYENIMNNMKILHFCWQCNKEHNATNWKLKETGITCDCGGYVVSPSGKVQSAIVPIVPVWKVDDGGEVQWIAAKDEQEIREFYKTMYDEELESDAVITQVTGLGLTNPFIKTEENPKLLMTLNDVVREAKEFPTLLASSVW